MIEEELNQAEEINAELTKIEDSEKNQEPIFNESENVNLELVDQEANTNQSEVKDVEVDQHIEEDSRKLADATLKSITFDKNEYMYGEEATVTITISSDIPIDYAEVELVQKFNSFEDSIFLGFSNFIKNDDGNYIARTNLYIEEKINGYEFISGYYMSTNFEYQVFNNNPDLQSVNFLPNPDTIGPEIKNIIFDKEEYEPGEIVKYEVHINHIRDIESLELYIAGEVYSSTREYREYIHSFTYDEESNYYIGRGSFIVSENTIDDTYTIKNMNVNDIEGYSTFYSEYYQNLNFESHFKIVNTGITDIDGPIVKDIIIGDGPYKRGEEIEITVLISDENDIDNLELEFSHYSDEYHSYSESINFYDFKLNKDGLYESTMTFRIKDSDSLDFSQNSIYTFEYGSVFDIYGNQNAINGDEFPISIEVYGEPDLDAPELISITTDKETYAPGEKAIITVILADESEINYAGFEFIGEDGNFRRFDETIFEFNKNSEGYYVGQAEVHIPVMTIDGKYSLVNFYATDTKENYRWDYAPLNLSFEVRGSGITDNKGPEIISIESDKTSYKRGEDIQITIVLADENLIDYVDLDYTVNNEYGSNIFFDDFEINNEGYYVGTTIINISDEYTYDFDKNAVVFLSWGRAYDLYGNRTDINMEQFQVSFELYGEPDLQAPKVIEIIQKKEQYKPGDRVQFKVIVSDETDVEYVRLNFESKEDNLRSMEVFIFDFEQSGDGNYFGYGEFIISENTVNAEYELVEVYTRDTKGNSNTVYENFDTTFEIVGSSVTDSIGPEIISIESDKDSYYRGEEVKITVMLRDENPIESLTLEFQSDYGNSNIYFYDFTLNDEGLYVSTESIRIGENYIYDFNRSSEYTMYSGYAHDLYGNRTEIQPEDYPLKFELYGEPDKDAPVIVDISLDEREYTLGEEIEITITVFDTTGVENGYLEFELLNNHDNVMDTINISLDNYIYNSNKELYEMFYKFTINKASKNGIYRLSKVHLSDLVHNFKDYSIYENNLPFIPEFTIKGLNDNAPVIEEVIIDGNHFLRGEEIEVTLIASDNYIVTWAEVLFETENGNISETVYLDSFKKRTDGFYEAKGNFRINQFDNIILKLHSANIHNEWGHSEEYDLSGLNKYISILPNGHTEGPIIHDIEFGKNEYMRGEDIEVSVIVFDDYEIHGVELIFVTEHGFNETSIWIDEFELLTDGKYRGTETFKLHEENTVWRFSYGIAYDEYYNQREHGNLELDASVRVTENPDKRAPEVISIKSNKPYYLEDDKLELTVTITDDSNVDSVWLSFVGEDEWGMFPVFIEEFKRIDGTNTFIGTIEDNIPDIFFELKTLKLIDIITVDEYQNMKSINSSYEQPELSDPILDLTLHFVNEDEIEVKETERTEVIPYKTEYINNPDLLAGNENIIQEGTDRVSVIIEENTFVKGELVSTEVLSETVFSPGQNQVIEIGTKAVEIEDVAKKILEETRTETISFETEIIYNPNVLTGEETILTEGKNGSLEVIEEVTYIGSEVQSRKEISRTTVTDPITQVIEVGTKAHVIEDSAKKVTRETSTKVIDFEIEYVNNPDLLVGTEVTSREGKNGIRTIVVEIISIGSKELSREKISDITTNPINQIVQIGTKAYEIEDTAKTISEETRTETIQFETERIENPELLVGTERVKCDGQNGLLEIIEEVTFIGDKITNRKEISRKVLTDSINRIIEVGTKAIKIEDNATKIVMDQDSGITASLVGSDNQLNLVVEVVPINASDAPDVLGSNYALYDISFVGTDGEELNPSEPVKITIPYDKGLKPLKVYYFGDNFEMTEELNFKDSGDSITFNFGSFSYFGIEFDEAELEDDNKSNERPSIVDKVEAGEFPDNEKNSESVKVVEIGGVIEDAEVQIGMNSSSNPSIKTTIATSDDGDLPPTGEVSMSLIQLLGLALSTIGVALGFKKRD